MANRKMILTGAGANRYRTRMLSAGAPVTMDGPTSRMWERMGWAEQAPKRAKRPQLDHDNDGKEGGAKKQGGDEIKALRAEYKAKVGKQPFNGWSIAQLKEKIAEA